MWRFFKNPEIFRYLASAAFATISDLGLFALIHGYLPELAAYAISYSSAVTARFLLDRYWTFPQQRNTGSLRQFLSYWVVALAALGLGSVIFAGLRILELEPLPAKILSVPPTTIVAFCGLKLWVFGLSRTRRGDAT